MPFTKGWKDKKKSDKKSEDKKVEEKVEVKEVDKEPIHKSFHIEKIKGHWNLVICELQGDKILSKTYKESDNKAMSLEYFKIQFAKEFYFGK